jgi:hypothetical protein
MALSAKLFAWFLNDPANHPFKGTVQRELTGVENGTNQ